MAVLEEEKKIKCYLSRDRVVEASPHVVAASSGLGGVVLNRANDTVAMCVFCRFLNADTTEHTRRLLLASCIGLVSWRKELAREQSNLFITTIITISITYHYYYVAI